MPGIFRLSVDLLAQEANRCASLGLPGLLLFPAIPKSMKDPLGSEALNPLGLIPRAIGAIKESGSPLLVIADIALDPYTDHGHDGLLGPKGEVLNDETVATLTKASLVAAAAGADLVAPSDMMDGRVGAIRRALDDAGRIDVGILAYSAKYASSFYGPFREALGSAPKSGDKKSYQMDPANRREALLEALLDKDEGADILMVKPALPYLDVIAALRAATHLPIAAYQVSGEYSVIMAAHQNGWLDATATLLESLTSIKRAGADMIISYAASQIAPLL